MDKRVADAGSGARVRRPDFMIIGAMKSGTSSLHTYIAKHPDVFMCWHKEPQFFSRQENYARGLDWYFSLFRGARDDQICGESSTCYSRWPYFGNVAARIHEAVPDARFIYVMRHPVERAYSHYRHEMEERKIHGNNEMISFNEALEKVPEIFDTSLYRRQIEKFLDYFPRDRLLLLFFEDLTREPAPVLEEVQRFLGLQQESGLAESKVVINPFGHRIAKNDLLRFEETIRRAPGVSALVKRVIPSRVRSWMRAHLYATFAKRRRVQAEAGQVAPLEKDVRERLLERFAAPNRELEDLMGRPVPSSWHQ
jgi:hypothetical protein